MRPAPSRAAQVALDTIKGTEPAFKAVAVRHLLQGIYSGWQVTIKWQSSDELWEELRPYVIGPDGRLCEKIERAFDKMVPNAELGGSALAVTALRLGALDWAHKRLEL